VTSIKRPLVHLLLLGVADWNVFVLSSPGMPDGIPGGHETSTDGTAINRFGWNRLCQGDLLSTATPLPVR